jgi:cytochrome c
MRPGAGGGLVAALLLLTAGSAGAQTAGGDVAKGLAAFTDRCTSCHSLDESHQGPRLRGVVGRKAASVPGFNYTDALKASGIVWTPATLDPFLTRPTKAVPGTAMRAAVSDPAERRDLIAYLASTSVNRR